MKKLLLLLSFVTSSVLSLHAQDSALGKLTVVDGVAQIATPEDLVNFSEAVRTEDIALNAVVTADLDMTGYSEQFVPIGIVATETGYTGHFDGQGHRISNLIIDGGGGYFAGLFSFAGDGAVIENLVMDETCAIINGSNATGMIASNDPKGAKIVLRGLGFEGRVESTGVYVGAIAGINYRYTASYLIENCYSTGSVTGGSNYVGQISGHLGDNSTMRNCWSSAEVTCSSGNVLLADYLTSTTTVENCYSLNATDVPNFKEKDIAGGYLCYLLNGDQSVISWTQTLGTDSKPVANATHKQVYADGTLLCDGTEDESNPISLSNEAGGTLKVAEHQFADGYCTGCGIADPNAVTLNEDGFYEISTPGNLEWFANRVDNGETELNAILTEDIDLTTGYGSVMIGTSTNPFRGVFDGGCHTVNVAYVGLEAYQGLFRYIENATIRNLKVTGTAESSYIFMAALVGYSSGTCLIENVVTNVDIAGKLSGVTGDAGLIGAQYGNVTINNCATLGMLGELGSSMYCGFVCYDNAGSGATTVINNCLTATRLAENTGTDYCYTFSRTNSKVTINNCYYMYAYGTLQGTQKTEEQFRSGEVCCLLNNGNYKDPVWRQTLGEDEFPVPFVTSEPVYGIGNVYMNVSDEASYKEFCNMFLESEQEYCENTKAQKTLIDAYSEALEDLSSCANIEELYVAYDALKPLQDPLKSSEAAYKVYMDKVEETRAYLEEHQDFSNEMRDLLEEYLSDNVEPCEEHPFGTYAYILEALELDEEQVAQETARVDNMLVAALAYTPSAGTEITLLLKNPTFIDGFDGWEGKTGTSFGASEESPIRAAECWNNTMDMYQTLTGLKNGVYELQVNGAFRPYPYTDSYNTNYAAMLYLNDNANYFQANIEDMISADEAVDGENCHTTGSVADLTVEDIDGNILGYVMQGVLSCCNAFKADRYKNSILVNVTDGTLKIGIKQPGTGLQPDWLGFGNIHLYYRGEIEDATESLDRVLASQNARAYTILNSYEFAVGADCAIYPNFSQALKDELSKTSMEAASATDNAAKYALVEKFSALFQEIYACKQAYISLMEKVQEISDLEGALAGLMTEDEYNLMEGLYQKYSIAYMDGTLSTEEALAVDLKSQINLFPEVEDGYYILKDERDFCLFSSMVNDGQLRINARLKKDLDMTDYSSSFTPIGRENAGFRGTFDGEGHRISNLTIDGGGGYFAGLFSFVGDGAVVKNLIMDSTCSIINGSNATAMIAANDPGSSCKILLSGLGFEGTVSAPTGQYVGAIAAINYQYKAQYTIENCYSTGSVIGKSNVGQITGHLGDNSVIRNCWSSAEIVSGNGTNLFADYITTSSKVINCYSLNAGNATSVTAEQLASGEVCFLLNQGQEEIAWTQTIGKDPVPVLGTGSDVVYATGHLFCSGSVDETIPIVYTNEEGEIVRDAHNNENGFCSVCGQVVPDAYTPDEYGRYHITSPDMLNWLAAMTDAGYTPLNVILDTDLDLTSEAYSTIMLGRAATPYTGTFDGNGHEIKVAYVGVEDYQGLFRFIKDATVRNLKVTGTAESTHIFMAGLAGYASGTNYIQNVVVNVDITGKISNVTGDAGMIGANYGSVTFSNCAVFGNFGYPSSSMYCGYVAYNDGNAVTIINNCFSACALVEGTGEAYCYPFARAAGRVEVNNCYYLNAFGTLQGTQMTAEQFASGEVCWLLNGEQKDGAWRQNLGEDAFPVPDISHKAVYLEDDVYLNEESERIPLITSAVQLSSNSSDSVEGTNIGALIDGDASTFWHTDWHGQCTDEYHYLQVELNEPFTGEITTMLVRRNASNDHPTQMKVWGSFDGETFFEVTTIELPFEGAGTTVFAEPFSVREPLKYLRFAATDCGSTGTQAYRTFWHTAEFQLYGEKGDGIEDLSAEKVSDGIYNLQGQKVQKAQKGIYIINGKKVFVK